MLENVFNSIHGSTVDEMIETFNESGIIPTKKAFQEKYKEELEKIGKPIVVPVKPQEGCQKLCCYTNVHKLIKKYGGESIQGYICWLGTKEMYLYFEPHIIYKSPTGEIYDPTPQEDKEENLLFMQTNKTFDGNRRYPSIYVPIDKHPEVLVFCQNAIALSEWISKNSRYVEKDDIFIWDNSIEYQKLNSGCFISQMLLAHYVRSLIEDNKNG
jgi:hypothetical protein